MQKQEALVDEIFMQRCLQLAALGKSYVAPNPMVGAVLVHNDRIIAEGYHQQFGAAHAEVNCINNVLEHDKQLIPQSTLYVSLEPCSHFGKTPPCSDLIIQQKIKKVIIGCVDNFSKVNGNGIKQLKNAGVEVTVGVLENECKKINNRFFLFNEKKRPYIILKWAETVDKKIAAVTNERLLISNEFTNRLVHKWRSEEAAILVGTNTALADNPSLNNRLWNGQNPVKLLVDKHLKLSTSSNIFQGKQKTIVFNYTKQEESGNFFYYKMEEAKSIVQQVIDACFQLKLQSILVEGGAKTIQHFIDENYWDEARIITNETLHIRDGLNAPVLYNAKLLATENIFTDAISYYTKK